MDFKEFPKAQAFSDYLYGDGFDANPYPKNSAEYLQYESEMNSLYRNELKTRIEQLKGEPSCL